MTETDKPDTPDRTLANRVPLENLTDNERCYLEAALKALRDEHGDTTPTENFIYAVLCTYALSGHFTQEDVDEMASKFKEDLEDAIRNARRMLDRYPILLAAPAWVEKTPDQIERYDLTMYIDATSQQLVEITREEFIALKQELARLRGLAVPLQAVAA